MLLLNKKENLLAAWSFVSQFLFDFSNFVLLGWCQAAAEQVLYSGRVKSNAIYIFSCQVNESYNVSGTHCSNGLGIPLLKYPFAE